MEIKFQDELLNNINNFNISNLPHAILLTGEKGSGKHLIYSYISNKFKLATVDISQKIDEDTFNSIYLNNIYTLYLIDINKLLEKEQNSLLKILEEPGSCSYFLLIAEEAIKVLPTIENRCFKLNLLPYSKENLKYFIKDNCSNKKLVLDISSTPGDAILFQDQDLGGMLDLSNKMIQKMGSASFLNALSISDKIAFKNEKGKHDFYTFLKVFEKALIDGLDYNNKIVLDYLKLFNELKSKLKIRNLNIKFLFENFIIKMWKASRA